MIRHIVMWKFKDEACGRTREENIAYIGDRLRALVPIIPQIKRLELGADVGRGEMSYDMVLVADYDSREDLAVYAAHPEHKKVSEYVAQVRVARAVVDYEI